MAKLHDIQLLVSDIDGVWTDGSFYYSAEGDSFRKFHTKDSYGIALAKIAKIPVLILSGEKNKMVEARMNKLGVKDFALGVQNKKQFLMAYCDKNNLKLSQVGFLGDDMNDYELLGCVGFFACPQDAYGLIKEKADKVLGTTGGNGVFREFVEFLLKAKGLLESCYDQYLKND